MNDQTRASLWQAYREQSVVWLLVTMLTSFLVIGIIVGTDWSNQLVMQIAVCSPALFLLVSLVMTIAHERERGTLERLRMSCPIPRAYLIGKLGWAIAATIAMLPAHALAMLVGFSSAGDERWASSLLEQADFSLAMQGAASWLEAAGWGLIATAYSRTVLRGLVTAGMLLFAQVVILWLMVGGIMLGLLSADESTTAMIWYLLRCVVAVGICLFGFRQAGRSLHVISDAGRAPSGRMWRLPLRFDSRRPRRAAIIGWQELRRKGRLIGICLVVLAIYQVSYWMVDADTTRFYLRAASLLFVSSIAGMSVFQSDWESGKFRFFEHLGVRVSTSSVWRVMFGLVMWTGLAAIWSCQTLLISSIDSLEFVIVDAVGQNYVRGATSSLMIIGLGGLFTFVSAMMLGAFTRSPVILAVVSLFWTGAGFALTYAWLHHLGSSWLWAMIVLILTCMVLAAIRSIDRVVTSRQEPVAKAKVAGVIATLCVMAPLVQFLTWIYPVPVPDEARQRLDTVSAVYTFPADGLERQAIEDQLWSQLAEKDQRYLEALQFFVDMTEESGRVDGRKRQKLLDASGDWAGPSETLEELYRLFVVAEQTGVARIDQPDRERGSLNVDETLRRYVVYWNFQNDPTFYSAWAMIGETLPRLLIDLSDDSASSIDPRSARIRAWMLWDLADFFERAGMFGLHRSFMDHMRDQLWRWCLEDDRTEQELAELLVQLTQMEPDGDDRRYGESVDRRFANTRRSLTPADGRKTEWWLSIPGVAQRFERDLMNWMDREQQEIIDQLKQVHESRLDFDLTTPLILQPNPDVTMHRYTVAPAVARAEARQLSDHRALVWRIAYRIYFLRHQSWPEYAHQILLDGIVNRLPTDPYTGMYFRVRTVPSYRIAPDENDSESHLVIWSPGLLINRPSRGNSIRSERVATGFSWDFAERDLGGKWVIRDPTSRPENALELDANEAFPLGIFWGLTFGGKRVDNRYLSWTL